MPPLTIANAYGSMIATRYVSGRSSIYVAPNGTASARVIPDSLALDLPPTAILTNGQPPYAFPYASPGLPYTRDIFSGIKHNGVPNDYSNSMGLGGPIF